MKLAIFLAISLFSLLCIVVSGASSEADYQQCVSANCNLGSQCKYLSCVDDCEYACNYFNSASPDSDIKSCTNDIYFPELMSCASVCCTAGSSAACRNNASEKFCDCVKQKKLATAFARTVPWARQSSV